MPVLSAQIITRALNHTRNDLAPEPRRIAMRQWLYAEGFQKSSIDESDDAIRAAIRLDSGLSSSKISEQKNDRARKQQSLNENEPKQPRKRWKIPAFFFLSYIFTFYLSPGNIHVPNTMDMEGWSLRLLSSGVISVVTLLLGGLLWALSHTVKGYRLASAVILGLGPLFALSISISESGGIDELFDVRTIATQYGAGALLEAVQVASNNINYDEDSTRTASSPTSSNTGLRLTTRKPNIVAPPDDRKLWIAHNRRISPAISSTDWTTGDRVPAGLGRSTVYDVYLEDETHILVSRQVALDCHINKLTFPDRDMRIVYYEWQARAFLVELPESEWNLGYNTAEEAIASTRMQVDQWPVRNSNRIFRTTAWSERRGGPRFSTSLQPT
jgi:hypothetical protein